MTTRLLRLVRSTLPFAPFVTAACASLRPTERVPITVVTYNIQAGAGNLQRIAEELRAMNADLVALQEVDVHWHARSGFAHQAAELAQALGVEMRFAPIYMLPGDSGRPIREFGVALLSKHRIESFRNDSLTRLSTQQANATPVRLPGLLNAVVNVRGTQINVLTAHLDYRADPAIRQAQVSEMLRILSDTMRTILAGDLNATPDAAELQPLFRRLNDVWPPNGGPGYTYPASAPAKRIDYILVSRLWPGTVAVVPGASADHRPVRASLFLVRP